MNVSICEWNTLTTHLFHYLCLHCINYGKMSKCYSMVMCNDKKKKTVSALI